jgi:hypothetical protein
MEQSSYYPIIRGPLALTMVITFRFVLIDKHGGYIGWSSLFKQGGGYSIRCWS